METHNKSLKPIAIGFIPFFLLTLLPFIIRITSSYFIIDGDIKEILSTIASISLLFINYIICIYITMKYIKKYKISSEELGLNKPKEIILSYSFAIAIGLVISTVITFPYMLLFNDFKLPYINTNISNNYTLIFMLITVAYSILEEFYFRGFILYYLRKYFKKYTSIALTSFMFALLYLNYDFGSFIAGFIFGFFLGWLRLKSNSIYPCLFSNIIANLTITIIIKALSTIEYLL